MPGGRRPVKRRRLAKRRGGAYARAMRRFAALALALLAVPALAGEPVPRAPAQWVPPPAKEGFSYPDCFCTDTDGQRVEKGDTACLRVGGDEFLARCGMSQNNPAWRKVQEDCGPLS